MAINIEINIDAKDLKTLDAQVGKVTVNIRKDFKKVDRSVNKTKKSLSGLSKEFSNIKRVLAGGIGVVVLRQFITAASDAEETQSKFNTVFKEAADVNNRFFEQFAKNIGRSTRDVKEWAASLQDTFIPLGFSVSKSAEFSQALVKLGVDVASFNNQADADVLRDFQSALVGNTETVRKYGVIITESTLKQAALDRGMLKNTKTLTELEKVQLRYELLLAGTKDAQGDAERTADSYANQLKRLQANFEDASQSAGELLIPALNDIVKSMNSMFISVGTGASIWDVIDAKFQSLIGISDDWNKSLQKVNETVLKNQNILTNLNAEYENASTFQKVLIQIQIDAVKKGEELSRQQAALVLTNQLIKKTTKEVLTERARLSETTVVATSAEERYAEQLFNTAETTKKLKQDENARLIALEKTAKEQAKISALKIAKTGVDKAKAEGFSLDKEIAALKARQRALDSSAGIEEIEAQQQKNALILEELDSKVQMQLIAEDEAIQTDRQITLEKQKKEAIEASKNSQRQLVAIGANVAQALAAGVTQGEKLDDVLGRVAKQLAQRAVAAFIGASIGFVIGGPGGAKTGAQLAGGFAGGGSFVVPGKPSLGDNTQVSFNARAGERITVTEPGKSPQGNSSVNLTINTTQPINRQFVANELIPLLDREQRRLV